jgi:hypothetical protein
MLFTQHSIRAFIFRRIKKVTLLPAEVLGLSPVFVD